MSGGQTFDGHLRWPALLTPSVGFLAFLGAEYARLTGPASLDGFIWILPVLIIANLFAFLPALLGAVVLLVVFYLLPRQVSERVVTRVPVGLLVGGLLGFPFAYVLNGMPAAGDDVRFNYASIFVASIVAGGFCALFFSPRDRSTAG